MMRSNPSCKTTDGRGYDLLVVRSGYDVNAAYREAHEMLRVAYEEFHDRALEYQHSLELTRSLLVQFDDENFEWLFTFQARC